MLLYHAVVNALLPHNAVLAWPLLSIVSHYHRRVGAERHHLLLIKSDASLANMRLFYATALQVRGNRRKLSYCKIKH